MFTVTVAPADAATPPAVFLIATAGTISFVRAVRLAPALQLVGDVAGADVADEADDDSGCYTADTYGD